MVPKFSAKTQLFKAAKISGILNEHAVFWSANVQAFARNYEILNYFVYYFMADQSRNVRDGELVTDHSNYFKTVNSFLFVRLPCMNVFDRLSLQKFQDRTKVDFIHCLITANYIT